MIKVSGLIPIINRNQKLAKNLASPMRKVLIHYGALMTKWARKDHEFNRKSGNAERSITALVEKNEIKMSFGILSKITDTKWKGGVSYVTFLHEGTGKGYRRSKAANKHSPAIPKTGYGILADHFIVRAWDKYYPKMVEDLTKTVKGAFEK